MPLYHCSQCHHEFERYPEYKNKIELCDWCSAPGVVIQEKTSLESMVDDIENSGGFEKWCKKKGIKI